MKSNLEVMKAFVAGEYAESRNVKTWADGTLYNYCTCICIWTGKRYILNATRYSNTTSKVQSQLRGVLVKSGGYVEVTGLEYGASRETILSAWRKQQRSKKRTR